MYSRYGSALLLPAFFALILTVFDTAPAHAQFQRTHGGASTEAGRGGVQQTFDGGFIAVGESNSGVPDYDVYVVKTNAAGVATWSFKYNIGHNDYGKHIQQTSDTGYIITGYTKDSSSCCSRDNLFLLKIDRNGTVQWVNSYGGESDEEGACVRELGNGLGYIVAGRSNSFGQGDYDAYLMRVNSTGGLVWSRVYGDRDLDYFRSCAQDSISDNVFAVGATSSYGNSSQGFAVRVDVFDGSLVWQYVYGGTKDEVFNSIRRISGGNLVVAGFTKSYTTSASALLLQLDRSGDVASSMVYRSNGGGGWSEFFDAVEINTGSIGVVGLFNNVTNGFGGYDMLVGEVSTWNMLMMNNRIYGGLLSDQGFSINRVGPSGPNVVSAGLTNSFGSGQQLYLIETNFLQQPLCNRSADIDTIYSTIDSIRIELPTSQAMVRCPGTANALRDSSASDSVCSHSSIESAIRRNDWQDDSSGVEESPVAPVGQESAIAPLERMIISSYPNPVRQGEPFVIDYRANSAVKATIEVVDMAGIVVHSEITDIRAGENRLAVTTAGWSSGSYVVRISVNGRSDSKQVIVIDR